MLRARTSFRTVRLVVREWQHVARSEAAFQAYQQRAAAGGSSLQYVSGSPRVTPVEVENVVRHWVDGERRREERGDMLTVYDGEHTWSYSPDWGAIVYDGETSSDLELLDPIALVPAFDLELLGEHRLLARPRGHVHPSTFGVGTDEVELVVHPQRGILMRIEARLGGEPFRIHEVTEAEFDVEFPADTFRFEAPAGEPVRPASEAYAHNYVTLEEAARHASYTLWAPRGLAPEWRHHALHRPASERPAYHEWVHLLFFDDSLHSFGIEETAEPQLAWRDVEPRLVDDIRVYDGRPLEVQLERGGTHLRLTSETLDADALVEIARSLGEVSTEPPSVF